MIPAIPGTEAAMKQTPREGLELLRVPFAEHHISYLPKGGVKLAYVGHAALTDRLLDADPAWTWEPLSMADNGLPVMDDLGGMWIRLTVCGVTRLGYGHAGAKTGGDAIKEVIGDALRNAAMRFGAALDLWHKGDLHADEKPTGVDQNTGEVIGYRSGTTAQDLAGFSPAKQKVIRTAAQTAILKFNQGDEMAAYEEVYGVVEKYGIDQDGVVSQDLRNMVLLAFSTIFADQPALRASLKKQAEAARGVVSPAAQAVKMAPIGPGLKPTGTRV